MPGAPRLEPLAANHLLSHVSHQAARLPLEEIYDFYSSWSRRLSQDPAHSSLQLTGEVLLYLL